LHTFLWRSKVKVSHLPGRDPASYLEEVFQC
jgi:hypothetical protein